MRMDNETGVPLPEVGTRIRPTGWGDREHLDVLYAAYNHAGKARTFGTDETGRLDSWNVGMGWELVVDENIERLVSLMDGNDCPAHVISYERREFAEYLVRNGVTAP